MYSEKGPISFVMYRAIEEIQGINWIEKILLSIIHFHDNEEKGGCYASNRYFAERLGIEMNSVAKMLVKFRKLGLIVDVLGAPVRTIRAAIDEISIKKRREKLEELGFSETSSYWKKIQGGLEKNPRGFGKKSNRPYIEKKEKKEEESFAREESPAAPSFFDADEKQREEEKLNKSFDSKQKSTPLSEIGARRSQVLEEALPRENPQSPAPAKQPAAANSRPRRAKLSQTCVLAESDRQKLEKEFTKAKLDAMIQRMEEWLVMKAEKGYAQEKGWNLAIRNWFNREMPSNSNKNTPKIDDRKKDKERVEEKEIELPEGAPREIKIHTGQTVYFDLLPKKDRKQWPCQGIWAELYAHKQEEMLCKMSFNESKKYIKEHDRYKTD